MLPAIHTAAYIACFAVEPLGVAKIVLGAVHTFDDQLLMVSKGCLHHGGTILWAPEQCWGLLDLFFRFPHQHLGFCGTTKANLEVKLTAK